MRKVIGQVVAFLSWGGSPRQDPAGASGIAAGDDLTTHDFSTHDFPVEAPRATPYDVLRYAWNGAIGIDEKTRFEHQEIVLTVPASFDEEARELTGRSRRAGLDRLTSCLKNRWPRFYAWIAAEHTENRTAANRTAQEANPRAAAPA